MRKKVFNQTEKRKVQTWNDPVCSYCTHGYGCQHRLCRKRTKEKFEPLKSRLLSAHGLLCAAKYILRAIFDFSIEFSAFSKQ